MNLMARLHQEVDKERAIKLNLMVRLRMKLEDELVWI